MWDDDNIGQNIQDIFAEPHQIMAQIPEINGDGGPAAIEIKPEQEKAIDAIEEQPVIVADEENNIDDDEWTSISEKNTTTSRQNETLKFLSVALISYYYYNINAKITKAIMIIILNSEINL